MPKRRPQYLQGSYYHFYNRGREKLSIFHNKSDYEFLLRWLKKYAAKYDVSVIAYCLLPNHYHFLIRQNSQHEARYVIQYLFNRYGKTYREKYAHSGTIFEGPYQVVLVENEAYLKQLCCYIHANPVKHTITEHVEEWHYSNYPEWMGYRDGTLVDNEFIAEFFGDSAEYQIQLTDYLQSIDSSPSN